MEKTAKAGIEALRAEIAALRAELAIVRALQQSHICVPASWPYWRPGAVYVGDVPPDQGYINVCGANMPALSRS
jgi:hypothetical protein